MKAILYARVSTDRKLDSRQRQQEVENQLPRMREFAKQRDWPIRREFVDRVSAGGKKKRSQFDEMMAACDRREAQVLIIWSLDRFSREGTLKTLLHLDRLQRSGVKVKSMCEPWLDPDSPLYELLVPIFAWIAKQERVRIGERVKAGIERARAQGRRHGRPKVAADVAKIIVMRRNRKSFRAIAKATGISDGTVRKLLRLAEKRVRRKPHQNR